MHREHLNDDIRICFIRVFKFESQLLRINSDCLNFHDRARVEIHCPLTTLSLDSLNIFQNEVEETLHVSCITNISIKMSKIIIVLALKER